MRLPGIDINALPLLDTAVGLFGSFAGEWTAPKIATFETTVTVTLIIAN
ncbi:hypothetical protein [Sphingopyxis witflariensis]|nr:hypothetical protein [Sphingopyxis witflariensis]